MKFSLDHFALQVQPGGMGLFTELMSIFGMVEIGSSRKKEPTRLTQFYAFPLDTMTVQATEVFEFEELRTTDDVHLGLRVDDTKAARDEVLQWAKDRDLEVNVEEVGERKSFIAIGIPDIFPGRIELVPFHG